MKTDVVIVAGGKGKRMGYEKNKVLMPLCGNEMLTYALKVFSENKYTEKIILVTGEEDLTVCEKIVKAHGLFKVEKIVCGGAERQESVYNGLKHCTSRFVSIHDGARALITDDVINRTCEAAFEYGAAAPGVKNKDTLKELDENGFISRSIDREKVVLIQTPQIFLRDMITLCHENARKENFCGTDDCMLAEKYGYGIKCVEGSYENIKLTTPEDISAAEKIIRKRELI